MYFGPAALPYVATQQGTVIALKEFAGRWDLKYMETQSLYPSLLLFFWFHEFRSFYFKRVSENFAFGRFK